MAVRDIGTEVLEYLFVLAVIYMCGSLATP